MRVQLAKHLCDGATIAERDFIKDKDYILPALYVYLLFTDDTKQKWITTGKITLDVALVSLGGIEIVAAARSRSVAGFLLGSIDIGLGVGDVILNQVFHNEITSAYPESGQDFCKSWQTISMYYGVGRLAGVGLGLDVGKAKAWLRNNNWRTNNNLSAETKGFLTKIDNKLTKTDTDFSQFAEYIDDVNDALRLTRAKFVKCNCADDLSDTFVDYVKRNGQSNNELDALDTDLVSNPTLLSAFNDEPELVDVWRKNFSNDFIAFKKDPDFLKAFKKVEDDNVWKHIEGEVLPNGTVEGGHYLGNVELGSDGYITNGKIRFHSSDVINPKPFSFGMQINKAKNIQIFDGTNWVPKTGNVSGFFPNSWTRQQILEETALAFKKAEADPQKYYDKGGYIIPSNDSSINIKFFYGVKGEINPLLNGSSSPKINTSFPNY